MAYDAPALDPASYYLNEGRITNEMAKRYEESDRRELATDTTPSCFKGSQLHDPAQPLTPFHDALAVLASIESSTGESREAWPPATNETGGVPEKAEWPVSYADWQRVEAYHQREKDDHAQAMHEKLDGPPRTTAEERSKKMAAALTAKENRELDLDMAEVCISQLNAEREVLYTRVAQLEAALLFEQKQRWAIGRQLSMLQVALGDNPAGHVATPPPQ